MKKYQKIIFSVFVLLFVFLVSFSVSLAADGYYGLDKSAETGYGAVPTEEIPTTIGKVIGAGLSFIGVAFLILMIYGGLLWMFARGNDQDVAKAKELITSAIIGLVIVMSAYAITAYIGGILTS